jgi:hypothetical protein
MDYKEDSCLCNWMQILRREIGNLPLNRVLIPGAHDSNTYSIPKVKALSVFARCQDKSLYTQLCNGIRFFDIRVGDFASTELKEVIKRERDTIRKIYNIGDSIVSGWDNSQSTVSKKDKLSNLNLFGSKSKNLFETHKKQMNKQKIVKKLELSFLDAKKQSNVNWNMQLSEMVEDFSKNDDMESKANDNCNLTDRSRMSLWDDFQNKSMFNLNNSRNNKEKYLKPGKLNKNKHNFLLINKSPENDFKNAFTNRRRNKKTVHISKSVRIKSI